MKASFDAITDLVNRTLTMSPSSVSSCERGGSQFGAWENGREATYPEDREGETLNERSQRAKVGSEKMRQHVDTLVDEVDGRSTRSGFGVHGVVGVHKVRDVGDVCSTVSVSELRPRA